MSLSESQVHRKCQTLAITWEILGSNLETGRYGSKYIWSLPDYPGELTALHDSLR